MRSRASTATQMALEAVLALSPINQWIGWRLMLSGRLGQGSRFAPLRNRSFRPEPVKLGETLGVRIY
jgi:hypothetical protein